METQVEYVLRKLDDPQINVSAVCKTIPVNRSKVYRLMKDKDGTASVVQKLHDHFKSLGD